MLEWEEQLQVGKSEIARSLIKALSARIEASRTPEYLSEAVMRVGLEKYRHEREAVQ